ncbi:MAG: 1-deoxy-D-xylulose-5-phosphate reductoisomerase [Vampirovibrionales bacterium]|nr:1-deoxy-D-xylulose-5-phosphate reductoisomerase [Vampirovibrionales bacterium]
MERMIVLGSTGSIGSQALDVLARFPERFAVVGLAAGGRRLETLAAQMRQFCPAQVAVPHARDAEALARLTPDFRGQILSGDDALETMACWDGYDAALIGVVGMRGLAPTLAALQAGRKVLTANKETFVAGGHLVAPYLAASPERLLPLDSEHSAIHQCLRGESRAEVDRLILTASGGPFRDARPDDLSRVTLADALRHPNWSMGPKITVDSATMMNKGLEIIEAHWLFDAPYDIIDVVIHPQSVVHSAVRFVDGSTTAQLGPPDMRLPILYALGYPQRLPNDFSPAPLDLATLGALEFRAPDPRLFPCLPLARAAGEQGGGAPTVLNAADEVAVELFLQESIRFIDIPLLIERALTAYQDQDVCADPSLSDILALDAQTRRRVRAFASCEAAIAG